MAQRGILLNADITGYTQFLHGSELEHARQVLKDLLNVLIEHTRSPLILVAVEGDSVDAYALDGAIQSPQTLIEMVERTYLAFRQALQLMLLNNQCQCNACRNIGTLDLKFFVHHGTFVREQFGEQLQLVGHDVNLIHRLMKNSITDTTGLRAYAAITERAVEAFGLESLVTGMPRHSEQYDDVGEVGVVLHDLHGVWQQRKNEVRTFVTDEEAASVISVEYPVPQPVLWEYVTKPEYRTILMGSDRQRLDRSGDSRTGTGSVFYCAHGSNVMVHTILDWEPFEQYTTHETTPFPGLSVRGTYRLVPTEAGTRLDMLSGPAQGPWGMRQLMDLMGRLVFASTIRGHAERLREKIEADLASGMLPVAAARVTPDRTSLNPPGAAAPQAG